MAPIKDVLWIENSSSSGQTKFFTRNTHNGIAITQDTVAIATVLGYTVAQFLQYRVIYMPPNMSAADMTNIVSNLMPKLRTAMNTAPLVVAFSFGSSNGNLADVGPELENLNRSSNSNTHSWVDATHILRTGIGYGGTDVGASIGSWGSTWHSYFEDLTTAKLRPQYKEVLYGSTSAQVIMHEYKYQSGFVILDGLTSKSGGWGSGNTTFANNFAKYCLYAYDNYCAPAEVEPEGSWTSAPISLQGVVQHVSNYISWTEDLPAGTTVVASAVITDTVDQPADIDFIPVTNGEAMPGVTQDEDLSNKYIWLKFNLSTSDITKSPDVSNIKAYFESYDLQNRLELNIDPLIRIHNNEGPITVTYDQNKGLLFAEGGYVESFSHQFTPTDLVPNPNPGIVEYVNVSAAVDVIFFQVTYKPAYNGNTSKSKIAASNIKVTLTQVGVVNP